MRGCHERPKGLPARLPDPPRRSEDNFVNALTQVYSALSEAHWVAPDEEGREWIGQLEDAVKNEILERLEDDSDDR